MSYVDTGELELPGPWINAVLPQYSRCRLWSSKGNGVLATTGRICFLRRWTTASLRRTYLEKVNAHLARWGHSPLLAATLYGQVNQLKAFVDICHLYGLAVIPDVVYNHAGGNLDRQSMDNFDLATDSQGRGIPRVRA